MKITTTYKTNAHGTGQILAKGAGKQRTVTYDPSKSKDWNHGAAAGTLLRVMWGRVGWPALDHTMKNIVHTVNDNQSHTFEV